MTTSQNLIKCCCFKLKAILIKVTKLYELIYQSRNQKVQVKIKIRKEYHAITIFVANISLSSKKANKFCCNHHML
jgi:hypothetical protein